MKKAEADSKIYRNKKLAYVSYLTEDIKKLEDDYSVDSLKLKNL